MNRLQKFVEQDLYGEKSGRTAYAFGSGNLPEADKGLEWKPVVSFRPAYELRSVQSRPRERFRCRQQRN
jgi:hypothetical protein